jgi:hypothetical protein
MAMSLSVAFARWAFRTGRSHLVAMAEPLDIELIEYAIADTPQLLRKGQEEAINDRRFAETIYRAAVASGIMERVAYQDTIAEAGRRWSERLLSRNVVRVTGAGIKAAGLPSGAAPPWLMWWQVPNRTGAWRPERPET